MNPTRKATSTTKASTTATGGTKGPVIRISLGRIEWYYPPSAARLFSTAKIHSWRRTCGHGRRNLGTWWRDDQMFLRFIVDEVDRSSLAPAGVFVVAYRLREAQTLPRSDHQDLLEVLQWFDENLDRPNRFTRSKRASRLSRGICWFRPSADEHIRKARELARVIDRHGIWVHMSETRHPGYVLFEDDQIVAEPFSGCRS